MYNLLFTVLSAYEMQYISKYVLLYYDFRKIFKKKEPKKIVHDLFLYSVNMHWCNSKLITYFGIIRFLRSFCYLNGKYEIFNCVSRFMLWLRQFIQIHLYQF